MNMISQYVVDDLIEKEDTGTHMALWLVPDYGT